MLAQGPETTVGHLGFHVPREWPDYRTRANFPFFANIDESSLNQQGPPFLGGSVSERSLCSDVKYIGTQKVRLMAYLETPGPSGVQVGRGGHRMIAQTAAMQRDCSGRQVAGATDRAVLSGPTHRTFQSRRPQGQVSSP